MNLCDFGCGQVATHYSKNSKKWRCSLYSSQCPAIRKQNSEGVTKVMNAKSENEWREITNKRKETCLEKYGVDSPKKVEEFIEKGIQTCLKKYGTENPQQNIEIRQKTIETCQERYGGPAPASSQEIQSKMKKTTNDRYGVDNIFQLPETWDKIKKTNQEKRGVEYHMLDPEHHKKRKEKYKEKTGYDNPRQNPEIVEKLIKTTREKYGVDFGIFHNIGSTSKIGKEWLDSIGLPNDNIHREVFIESCGIVVDGYDPSTNTIYEFFGDFWHGNPNVFDFNNVNDINHKTFQELYENTLSRCQNIKDNNFNLVYIWESEYKQTKNILTQPPKE